MQTRPFRQVDVFGSDGGFGNPLAVVLDGQGLTDAAMQRFANWTNLSETTFLTPPTQPGADYRVRIFTPSGELPFAGHPTLGSCHAWLEAGGAPQRNDGVIVQESAVGLVPVRRSMLHGAQRLAFAAPPLQRSNPSPSLLAQIAAALGLRPQQVLAAQMLNNGASWLGLQLDSAQTVLALNPDHTRLKNLGQKVGVAHIQNFPAAMDSIAKSAPDMACMTVRAFAAPMDVLEDPVTGSLNASLAQWMIADGLAPERYAVSQGERLGRAGVVHIERDADGQVWVGGAATTYVEGCARV